MNYQKVKFISLFAAVVCFWGCASHNSGVPAGKQAVSRETKVFFLGKQPDQSREKAFQDLLVSAQNQVMKDNAGDLSAGFSYSFSPKGAVYPFSEVEVVCLTPDENSRQGKKLCSDFFRRVDLRARTLAAY